MPFDNTAFYILFFILVFKANAEALDKTVSICMQSFSEKLSYQTVSAHTTVQHHPKNNYYIQM